MSDEKNFGNRSGEDKEHKNPNQQQNQQKRAPGSEQEHQGDQSNDRRGNVDQEQERKRA